MKKTWLAVLVLIIIGLVGYAFLKKGANKGFDPLNATYSIEGQSVTLADGKAEMVAAPGSATKVVTTIFGQPVSGDLNGDGVVDAAVMLVQDPGGSGTFYYVATAINNNNVAQGSNAILLGDRIAPQNITIKSNKIVANYADRKPGDPMTAPPSVGVTKYFIYDRGDLKETFPGDLTLGVGQTGSTSGLSITFNALVQDSRCPIDVECIEAGAVNTNVTFKTGTKTETRNMASDGVPLQWNGYKISITDITPPRKSHTEIAPGAYRITFHVGS
jgi:hypothetical protein